MSSTIITNPMKRSTAKDSNVTAGTAELVLDGISKSFGGTMVLQPLRLTVPGGALVALLGPSGCGKTTTLRIIAGFERADTGRVTVGGTDISSLPPNRRRLGMVFQNYSLFPHMTIADNVAFGLKMAGCPKSEIGERVGQTLATVRLAGMDARYPNQLSGGQQQRVALARSLVTNPKVLLLDEPLGALDKNLRESMQFELRQLQQTLGITTVLVTHDQEEALTMSDQVAVMRDGRLVQFGPPSDVYHRPVSRFVAEFLGASNVIEVAKLRHAGGRLEGRLLRGGATIEATAPEHGAAGEHLQIAVRPENISVSMAPLAGINSFAAVVTGQVFRGSHHAVRVTLSQGGQELLAYVPPRDVLPGQLDAGSEIWLRWRPEDASVLDAEPATAEHHGGAADARQARFKVNPG
jgi:putative spermidine/putrescine transport system ATP-binding protein